MTEEELIAGLEEHLQDQQLRERFVQRIREEGWHNGLRIEITDALERQATKDEWAAKMLSVEVKALDELIALMRDEMQIARENSAKGMAAVAFLPDILSKYLAISVPILFLLLALVNWLGSFWHPVGLVLNVSLYLVAGIMILGYLFVGRLTTNTISNDQKENKEIEYLGCLSPIAAMFVLAVVALTVAFSQSSRHLYALFSGFSTEHANSYWGWLRFGITNVMDSALIDAPSIYGFAISSTMPTSIWSQTWVFVFRLLLEVLVIGLAWKGIKAMGRFRTQRVTQTAYTSYGSYMARGLVSLFILLAWIVPLSIGLAAVLYEGLSTTTAWPLVRLASLFTIGAWLAYRSARTPRSLTVSQRILGVLGVLAGIFVIWVAWRIF